MRKQRLNGKSIFDLLTNVQARKAVLTTVFCCFIFVAALQDSHAESEIPSFDRVRVLQKPRLIADAELTDQDGKPFKISDLQGRVAFVFFGFTHCPDVCPMAMNSFRQLERSGLVDNEQTAYVLISVDGERDTPEAMTKFLATYSPDFIGLTGDPRDVKPIAKQFSVAFFKGNESPDKYQVSHSPQAFVLDRSGQLRAELYSASTEAMAGVANVLLEESFTGTE
jgi:protein SCO1/2